jgi:HEAT repeat protein
MKFAGISAFAASQNANTRLNLDQIQPQMPEGVEGTLAAYLEQTPPDVHTATARCLVAFALGGGRKTDTVIHALRNMLPDESDVAASVLGFSLPMLLDWRNWYYAGSFAGLSLIRLGDHDSAARIIELAMSKWIGSFDEGPEQTGLIQFMFDHGCKEVVPILAEIVASTSKSRAKRQKAISWLAALGDAQVPSIIARCSNDPDADIRLHVIKKLEQMGNTPLVIQTLAQMTGDKKMAVRNAAKKALKRLGT